MNKHRFKFNMPRILALGAMAATLTSAMPAFAQSTIAGQSYGSGSAEQSYGSGPVAPPAAQTYTVGINKTEILRLPIPASAVLVGNPNIADVSIYSSDTIFVIGRSYGETDILILDTEGRPVLNANIQVNNQVPRNGVRVFFGSSDRESYHCTPYCAAAPVLGDSPNFIGANSGGSSGINNTLALGAPTNAVPQDVSSLGAADGGQAIQ